MKIIVLIVSLLFATATYSQDTIQKTSKEKIIDSLKSAILSDTIKFSKDDLIKSYGRTENRKGYSALYVINTRFYYRLDIINSKLVEEFVNEYLNLVLIENIKVLTGVDGASIFGTQAEHGGVVMITTKKKIKFNPFVAGFSGDQKKGGNNLDQGGKQVLNVRH